MTVIETKSLLVTGMHCASCAAIIKRKIEKIEGVQSCAVNFGTEKAQIAYDSTKISVESMNEEIGRLGYKLVGGVVSTEEETKRKKIFELEKLKQQVQIVLPMVAVSILVMIWEVGEKPLGLWPKMPEMWMEFFHHLLPIFATYTLFGVGVTYLKGVVRFLKYGAANMDTLVGMGTLVAFIYSFAVTAFEKVLPMNINPGQNYFDVTIVVIGFITLGKYLEARSKLKTGEAIEKLMGLQAKMALVVRDGKEAEVPIDEVLIGEVVVVKPGQIIPLDGVIVEGKTSVDESMITGESIPVDKVPGNVVVGATINKQGSLRVRVTKIGEQTMLAKIIRMVEKAQGSKAPIERMADQVSAVFVPVVLVLALVTLVVWLVVGGLFMPLPEALSLGVVSLVGILVIACPCAMGLATPTAIIVGVGRAAQNGILIKNAESLERFSGINIVVFDKTGTITKGMPEVTDVIPAGLFSEGDVLKLLASLEKYSEHPLAQAVVKMAENRKISSQKVDDFSAIEGRGLAGVIKGRKYFAGNLKLAGELKLSVDENIVEVLVSQGKTPVVLMTEENIVGYVGIADKIHEEAPEVVTQLHKQGIEVAMLTGDHRKTAEYIGKLAGIDRVVAEVMPGGKVEEIEKLQSEGYRVAMVGDGINDAPALATADLGVAMGTGTDVAIESAGITLLGGNITRLPKAINLARATMRIIRQNLFWAFFYNIIGIPIAAGLLYPFFGILLSPAIAGAAMGLSSVSVVTNSLRLKTVRV